MLDLAIQIAAVAAAALLAARLAGRRGPSFTLAGVVVVLAVASAPQLWASTRQLNDQRVRNREPALAGLSQKEHCADEVGIDAGFVRWLNGHMPPRARYRLVMSQMFTDRTADLCIAFLLLPKLRVTSYDDADWVVFYEDVPADDQAKVAARGGTIRPYSPQNTDLALARLRRGGR